jgi:hypothetical protein
MGKAIRSPRAGDLVLARIAAKHGVEPGGLKGRACDRYYMAARDELIHALRTELHWSVRYAAEWIGVSKSTISLGQKRHLQTLSMRAGQKKQQRTPVPNKPAAPARLEMLEDEVSSLRDELRRLTGADLATRLVARLDMTPSTAIVVAALAENYPRPLTTSVMCEQYEAAKAAMGLDAKPVSDGMINLAVMEARNDFRARGWGDPIEVIQGMKARKLATATAAFMSGKFGAPRPAQLPDDHWREMAALIADLPTPLHRKAKERSAAKAAAALSSGPAAAVRRAPRAGPTRRRKRA